MSMGFRSDVPCLWLEDRQLAGLLLLLSSVVQAQHGLVHHPGEQEDLLDLLGSWDAAQLVVQDHGDLRLEEPLLLVGGCHMRSLSQNSTTKSRSKMKI